MGELELKSPEFEDGGKIPDKYGYKKQNINPPLKFLGVPEDSESLVLIVDDPDAVKPAGKVWDHWVVWNIDPNVKEIKEGAKPSNADVGRNDYGDIGYGGPNPPDRIHTYEFSLYALDKALDISSGSTKDKIIEAMEGHIIDEAILRGSYAP